MARLAATCDGAAGVCSFALSLLLFALEGGTYSGRLTDTGSPLSRNSEMSVPTASVRRARCARPDSRFSDITWASSPVWSQSRGHADLLIVCRQRYNPDHELCIERIRLDLYRGRILFSTCDMKDTLLVSCRRVLHISISGRLSTHLPRKAVGKVVVFDRVKGFLTVSRAGLPPVLTRNQTPQLSLPARETRMGSCCGSDRRENG